MTQQQKNSLLFISQLNTQRLALRQHLDTPSLTMPSQKLTQSLLQMQLLLYQNKNHYQIGDEIQNNTNNLMKLINWDFFAGKFSIHGDDQKYSVNFQDDLYWDDRGNERFIEKGVSKLGKQNIYQQKHNERQTYFKSLFKPPQQKTAPTQQKNPEEDRKKAAQFISAASLPKGTSVRKKFVPPFKKPTSPEKREEPLKQQIDKDSDEMDPRYQNLQAKLVQIIESEILEKEKKVQWGQIAGLGFAKKIIHQMIVWPMLRPDIFTGLRAPPKGILLFGPPGTGKTMIGRAIASEAQATFFSISASSITSKWVGESQKLVKTLFTIARMKQPSVIFIDEIDSLLCSRKEGEQESSRRVKTQFLVQLDGAKSNNEQRILIIGATNLPQQLDDAVRRRFVKRLYIPLPNFQGRRQLLTTLTSNLSFNLSQSQKTDLSYQTKGYSGADMYNLCSQASMIPLRMLTSIQSIRTSEVPVTKYEHFMQALKLVRPSVNGKLLSQFQNWNKMYGSYQLSPDELQKQEIEVKDTKDQ